MYTIDTKSNNEYFIILKEDGTELCKVAKSCNTLDQVKKLIGLVNIKEVI